MFMIDTSQIAPLLVGIAIVMFVFGSIGCLILGRANLLEGFTL